MKVLGSRIHRKGPSANLKKGLAAGYKVNARLLKRVSEEFRFIDAENLYTPFGGGKGAEPPYTNRQQGKRRTLAAVPYNPK